MPWLTAEPCLITTTLVSVIFWLQFCTAGESGAVASIFIYSQWSEPVVLQTEMPLLFTLQYYSQCWNGCCCPVWGHIYTISTRVVVDTRTENKCSWQSIIIITSLTMMKRNIHSLLTLAAEPSEPRCRCSCTTTRLAGQLRLKVGLGASRPGKAQPRFVHDTPSGRKGLLAWSLPSLCCSKKSQVHFARASNATFRSHQDQSKSSFYIRGLMHKLSLCLWFQHWSCIVCLEKELLSFPILCLFSACVTAKVQTMSGSCVCFSSQQQQRGAVWE